MDDWIKKMWLTPTRDYYSAVEKRNTTIYDNMDKRGG